MKDSDSLKQIVKDKYASIAMSPKKSSCGCCEDGEINYSIMSLNYAHKDGYVADADLKLGFSNVNFVKGDIENIPLPDEYLLESVSQETIDHYRASGAGIFSITVVGTK